MKKSLLFILPSLAGGGAEKSLITLLSLIDYSRYDVDLFLFRREGLFLPNVPEEVNIIDGGEGYSLFDGEAAAYIKKCVKNLRFFDAVNRIIYSRAVAKGDRKAIWRCLKKALPKTGKHYDVAVGYLEGNANYYCVDCTDADVKIGYIHNDYSKLGLDENFDRPFFGKLDKLVSVSDECCDVLWKFFPEIKERIVKIENISSPEALKKFAVGVPEEYAGADKKILLTVGRFSPQKGYDTAVDAAKILKDNGAAFKWFAIGKGELKKQIEEKIEAYGLREDFILLGEKSNPYPYIQGCDIYVQPSNFEGKSIAIDEAKAFSKPIVATKFSTVFDQLSDGETALLAEIDARDVADKIMRLINDKALCKKLSDTLARTHRGNEEELEKFYKLLER
ncbi:MAG: glycosyltransferase [Clostridia bacterium]|nr:glycosyltransferase [Clostridia bacterium]